MRSLRLWSARHAGALGAVQRIHPRGAAPAPQFQALRAMDGVAGMHIMAHRHEELVPEILNESGLTREREAAAANLRP